jgi:hypothetical protein
MFLKNIFKTTIIFWFMLSFFGIFVNFSKAYVDAKNWTGKTDLQKKNIIFEDLYLFLNYIEEKTPQNSRILIYGKDERTHYLSVYVLYPRYTVDENDFQKFLNLIKNEKYDYVAIYKFKIPKEKIILFSDYNLININSYGELYKRK